RLPGNAHLAFLLQHRRQRVGLPRPPQGGDGRYAHASHHSGDREQRCLGLIEDAAAAKTTAPCASPPSATCTTTARRTRRARCATSSPTSTAAPTSSPS